MQRRSPSRRSFDGLIVLGGIVNPDGTDGEAPLDRERELIADVHERGLPVLGICLGAQLIAQALDGSAHRMPAGEVGWVPIELDAAAQSDALLAGAPRRLDVNEWHNYACTPPAGASLLARSPACIQAFRIGATTWGLQFHVEVTRPVLEEWCAVAAGELEALGLVGICSEPTSIERGQRSIGSLRARRAGRRTAD
jgi:GMP synthase-like glutamine amidotransferase